MTKTTDGVGGRHHGRPRLYSARRWQAFARLTTSVGGPSGEGGVRTTAEPVSIAPAGGSVACVSGFQLFSGPVGSKTR